MRNISTRKFQAKKEQEPDKAGRIGIRQDSCGIIVTMADGHGNVIHVRVIKAQRTLSSMSGQTIVQFKDPWNKAFPGIFAPTASEVPDSILPLQELAALDQCGHQQEIVFLVFSGNTLAHFVFGILVRQILYN